MLLRTIGTKHEIAESNPLSVLPPEQRARLDQSSMARKQIAQLKVLNVEFYPRESHLITFRDPWSFPTLFHPACNHLVRKHMDDLAQKVESPQPRIPSLQQADS